MKAKTLFLLSGVFLAILVNIGFVSAAVVIVSPANSTNNSGSITVNASYVNGTDITDPLNANTTWYYSNSAISVSSFSCTASSCTATWDTTGVADNSGALFSVIFGNVTTTKAADSNTSSVIVDNTVPIVFNGNITSPASGGNYSGNFVLNISVVDATVGVGTVFFNVTNSSGAQNGTFTASQEGTSDSYSVTVDSNSLVDGTYNITAYVNDSVGNLNNSALVTLVTIDNTVLAVSASDINSPASGSNQSGNVVLNVSVSGTDVGTVFFNVTNSSGAQNATYTATREGTTSRYSVSINTSHFPDGSYNITVYANDSVGNLNNSALSKEIIFDNTKPSVSLSCTPSPVLEGNILTCTCSRSDATSGISSVSNTANPSTSSSGTFSTSCTVTDYSGNSKSVSVNYLVDSVGGSPVSQGSGGGSSATTAKSSDSSPSGGNGSLEEGGAANEKVSSSDSKEGKNARITGEVINEGSSRKLLEILIVTLVVIGVIFIHWKKKSNSY